MAPLSRSALIISTTPPVPREYGNRNRILQTMEFLRGLGFSISFILYPFDEEWARGIPDYYRDLVEMFDYFAVIPNSLKLHQNAVGYYHEIDEWWDENLARHLVWLSERKHFDVLFVNYTFLSKAFECVPKNVLKILDTHDLFTGRRETFEQNGVAPEFFYTSADREKIAFDRADVVIAIKDSEAEYIRTLTNAHVVSLPYWDNHPVGVPAPRLVNEPVFAPERKLRLGFIGAHNSVNIVNMRRFLKRFERYMKLYNPPVEIVIAGNVCRMLHEEYDFVVKLGRVKDIADFYDNIDAAIAPLEFSTGIKIKVGEALAWKLPVLATQNAFDGFRPYHVTQSAESVSALCDAIVALAYNEISYGDLHRAAEYSARHAAAAQDAGFNDLRQWIKEHMRRILVVTDCAAWRQASYADVIMAQAVEYASHIAHPVVLYLNGGGTKP